MTDKPKKPKYRGNTGKGVKLPKGTRRQPVPGEQPGPHVTRKMRGMKSPPLKQHVPKKRKY